MQNQGKKITLFLVDGEPDGRKTLTLGGWSGLGLVFPRNKLKELGGDLNARKPGVYFLFGKESEDSLVTAAYIGEAENIADRLATHNHDKAKDFWHMTVAFVASDDSLTKAHVKYLESRCTNLAYEAKHFGYSVKNGKESNPAHLHPSDIPVMEEFVANITLLLATIGYPLLQKRAAKQDTDPDSPLFTAQNAGLGTKGIARMTNEGFVVYKGSSMPAEPSASVTARYRKILETLAADGITRRDGDKYIFEQDYSFTSPSTAAILIVGYPINGWELWKTAGGKTLDEVYRSEKPLGA